MASKPIKRGAELDLSDLPEERDTIRDEDGKVYELKPMSEFSAGESTRLSRVYSRYQNAHKLVGKGKSKQAEAQVEQASFELIRLILPDMPADRVKEIKVGKRGLMVDFWQMKERERREAIGLTSNDVIEFTDDEGEEAGK